MSTGRTPRRQRDADVVSITAAPAPLTDDLSQRTRRYLFQMSVRVVCFVGAVAIEHWTRWVLLAGAVVLPYVAVLLANAGRERGTDPGTYLAAPALPAGTTAAPVPDPGAARRTPAGDGAGGHEPGGGPR